MDLLRETYGATNSSSDDEQEGGGGGGGTGGLNLKQSNSIHHQPSHPTRKRQRSEQNFIPAPYLPLTDWTRHFLSQGAAVTNNQAPLLPGRYVSKRERESSMLSTSIDDSELRIYSITADSSSVAGSISDSDLPPEILATLKGRSKNPSSNKPPTNLSISLIGHTKACNSIQWSHTHSHLLASASMDHTIIIWSPWNSKQPKARILKHHYSAVKDLRWAPHGLSLLSCGFDFSTRLTDIETGKEIRVFKQDQFVETVRFCPSNPNVFLCGGSNGSITSWDLRRGDKVGDFVKKGPGPILDLEFSKDGKEFVSSSDETISRISENCIVVWDLSRQISLSNQVYTEAYSCPCVRYHPYDSTFVAQSNGNYIAIFSAKKPFKLDKYRRYESHGVWGFSVKCNFSSDGKELASGSSDGCVYFYDYKSCNLLRKIKAFDEPCIDVAYHPIRRNVLACCSWNGQISILE
ncbi:hypothetical protein LUZ60_016147 [Juncus effusus]|nr:hypothetical protein LUZ60_016147 [Juncus effusus]